MLLFLSNNKLLLHDRMNCYVMNACIFLFSMMILTACQFPLYIFGLDGIISYCYYCIIVTIKCYKNIHFMVSTVLLIFIKGTICLKDSFASKQTYNVSVQQCHCFWDIINCNHMIKKKVSSLMHVYFCSRNWSTWPVCFACIFLVSTTTHQIYFIVSESQYNVVQWYNILYQQNN